MDDSRSVAARCHECGARTYKRATICSRCRDLRPRRQCDSCGKLTYKGATRCADCIRARDYSERPCPICSRAFIPKSEQNKWCSTECRWRAQHPEYDHVCEECGTDYRNQHRNHRFCTYVCNKKFQSRKHYTSGYRQPLRTSRCQECRVSFQHQAQGRRFCDGCQRVKRQRAEARLHAAEAARQRQASARIATRRRVKRMLGERKLRAAHTGIRGRGRWVNGICAVCSVEFTRRHLQGSVPKTCGDRRCVRIVKAGAKVLRNERLRQAVFLRDNWTCGLCGQPVDPDTPWPSPEYPTIDHIKPRSLGGSDDLDNLQCAHHYCNTAKGARYAA